MKKTMLSSLVGLFLIIPILSFSQLEYKTDVSNSRLAVHGAYNYTVGNTLYYLAQWGIVAVNLENGKVIEKNWEKLGGTFLNENTLRKNKFSVTKSNASSSNGHIKFILQINADDKKEITFLNVVLDKDLKIIEEESIFSYESEGLRTAKGFITNPETGISVFAEYIKKEDAADIMHALFFNREMKLVSNQSMELEVPDRTREGMVGVNFNSLYAVSTETALINIHNQLYFIANDAIKPLEIKLETNLRSYMIKPTQNDGFVIVGPYKKEEQHGIAVLDFNKKMLQTSVKYVALSDNLLADCKSQIKLDFSKKNYGTLELLTVFVDENGFIQVLAKSIPMKNKNGGIIDSDNISLITIDNKRELVKTVTIPTVSTMYSTSLNTDNSIKIIFVDSPKFYDKLGNYNQKAEAKSGKSVKLTVLAEIVIDKTNHKLISRKTLDFKGKEKKLGDIVYTGKVAGDKDALMLTLLKYGKKDHYLGKYK